MLEKVLKYDLKSIGKRLIPLYLITILLSVITKGLYIFSEKYFVLQVISFTTNIAALGLILALIFVTFIVALKRFYTNLFKEEGYLTNALPVKLETHILSKFISAFIYSILSILVIFISLYCMYYGLELVQEISSFIEVIKEMLIIFGIVLAFSYFSYLTLCFVSYSIGQRKNKNKIVYSVITGFILYVVTQIITLAILFVAYKINPEILKELDNNNSEMIKKVLYFVIGLQSIYIIIHYFLTASVLKKKMDLE